MTSSLPLALSVGDPAGIGPLVVLTAAAKLAVAHPLAIFGDAEVLTARAALLGIDASQLVRASPAGSLALEKGRVALVHVDAWSDVAVYTHAATAEGGRAALASLDHAALAVREGRARSLVTGPMSKHAATLAGVAFRGQTEHLAAAVGLAVDAVTMLFLGPRLRVGLVTTHLAVRDVPAAITEVRVARTAVHLGEALVRLDASKRAPRVAVAGLNPHAGEAGMFGDEEARAIAPGIAAARMREPYVSGRAGLEGPVPAETAFRLAADGAYDGVVAMMHDQATIASKLLDWGDAVNVTWGLPFLRTSVDHGVGYDAAARGEADARGMIAAIEMAARLG